MGEFNKCQGRNWNNHTLYIVKGRRLYIMNSTKVQNPRLVYEPYIHWNPASYLIQNSEELAQPQRTLEKHAVLYFR